MTRADAVALFAPLVAGALGSLPTARAIPTWYRTLDKPSWNPPDKVFGPVWTALYGLMGVALVLVRREPATSRAQGTFGVQLGLNLAWSFVFFGNRNPRGAFVVIGMLWVTIVATIAQFWQARPLAAVLLLPYLGWVSFASLLNAEIWRRNPRAGDAERAESGAR